MSQDESAAGPGVSRPPRLHHADRRLSMANRRLNTSQLLAFIATVLMSLTLAQLAIVFSS
jgi:hypothetical protein